MDTSLDILRDYTLIKMCVSDKELITYDAAILVYKTDKELCLGKLNGKFTRRSPVSKYETRQMRHLQISKLRLEILNCFSFVGAKVCHSKR